MKVIVIPEKVVTTPEQTIEVTNLYYNLLAKTCQARLSNGQIVELEYPDDMDVRVGAIAETIAPLVDENATVETKEAPIVETPTPEILG